MKTEKTCSLCGAKGTEVYGYTICESCKAKLGLFTDETIKKQIARYENSAKKRSYEEEIDYRLDFIEKDYIKKKIKLLHIQEKLKDIK